MTKIDETKLERELANKLEEGLRVSLEEFQAMEPLSKELATAITIPIAKYLEMSGYDSDTRYDFHLMIIRAISLSFAQYFERTIKPDGMDAMVGITTKWFGDSLITAISLTQERRFLEMLKKEGVEIDIFTKEEEKWR
jgi:hypothetical protein